MEPAGHFPKSKVNQSELTAATFTKSLTSSFVDPQKLIDTSSNTVDKNLTRYDQISKDSRRPPSDLKNCFGFSFIGAEKQ